MYMEDTHPQDNQPTLQGYKISKDLDQEMNENLLLNDNNQSSIPLSQINLNSREQPQLNPSTSYPRPEQQDRRGIVSKIFSPFVNFITSFCGERKEIDPSEEDRIFSPLPGRVKTFNTFTTHLKTRIGILIIYNKDSLQEMNELVSNIINDQITLELIQHNCVVYVVLGSSIEGKRISSLLPDNLLLPAFFFAYNDRNNNTFNRSSVAERLEGTISVETFKNVLLNVIDSKQKNKKKTPAFSNAEIIEQQKRDLEKLERIEEMKKKQEREALLREKQAQKEEEERLKELMLKAEKAKRTLPEEPSKDDPNSTSIVFRYPDGEKRIERRFLKTNKVQILYDFIFSLGREIYTEPDYTKFSLIQPFPFKTYDNMDKTLEEESLFPNAVLQIKEEE